MSNFEHLDIDIMELFSNIEATLQAFHLENKEHLAADGSINKNFIEKIGGISVYQEWLSLINLKNTLQDYLDEVKQC